ncbi:MAG: bifunctional glutamate N-acetyltransferase/amino-acid acetyltransferase ArgJ [Herpetosiphon sp.]
MNTSASPRIELGGPITATAGIEAAGIAAGIKKNSQPDVALIVTTVPAVGAAVFTRNEIKAAPVLFDQRQLAANRTGLRAVVINSGCANAVTGSRGLDDAAATARAAAHHLDIDPASVLVMSTGVIGQFLPMDLLTAGIGLAALERSSDAAAGHRAARAIMTTDTRSKEIVVDGEVGGVAVTISGICKGVGMINPNMATLLAVMCTDVAITPDALDEALHYAADRSFNAMTIDGDTSTNDTLLVLATGLARNPLVQVGTPEATQFRDLLIVAATELAKLVARDGEGATKFVTIVVRGARSWTDAMQIAKTIANSPLVKTAIFGADANWGRILMAAGHAGIPLEPQRLALWFDQVHLMADGAPLAYEEADAHATLCKPEVTITLDLGVGHESATVWTCDFSHDYVSINADYRT